MKRLVILIFLAISCVAFAQQPCYICDSMPPYKHSIMFQFNRAFDGYRDIYDYFTHVSFEDGLPRNYYANLRYGYRVHKNIMVGPELMFFSQKRLMYYGTTQNILNVISFNVGGYARFIVNRWQIFKPYTDVGMSYNYAHIKYSWSDNYKPTDEEIQSFPSYNYPYCFLFLTYFVLFLCSLIFVDKIHVDIAIPDLNEILILLNFYHQRLY